VAEVAGYRHAIENAPERDEAGPYVARDEPVKTCHAAVRTAQQAQFAIDNEDRASLISATIAT
jgi:hypothetical protein